MPGATDPDVDPRVERTHRDVRSAVNQILVDEGFDSLTHLRVAEVAGYARNTLYRHFPERTDLLRLAGGFDDPDLHSTRTGDTRTDLIAELTAYRDVLDGGDLAPLMASLIERSEHDDEVADMRTDLSRVGSAQLLQTVQDAADRGEITADIGAEEIADRLNGPVTYTRLCHGRSMTDAAIERLVDAVLASVAP